MRIRPSLPMDAAARSVAARPKTVVARATPPAGDGLERSPLRLAIGGADIGSTQPMGTTLSIDSYVSGTSPLDFGGPPAAPQAAAPPSADPVPPTPTAVPDVLATATSTLPEAHAEPLPTQYWQTNDDGVRLRQGPSTSDPIVTALPEHTLLRGNGEPRDGWVPVTTARGESGWVSAPYTTAVAPEDRGKAAQTFEAQERFGPLYVNQLDAEGDVGLDRDHNANCGPTSLAIALDQQGLSLPDIDGIPSNGTAGAWVQKARYAMYHGTADEHDGVEDDGQGGVKFSEEENRGFTNWQALDRGADAAQAKVEALGSTDDIAKALDDGKTVIVSGSFVELDANGDVKTNDQGLPVERADLWPRGGGATLHIVALTGRTADGDFIVCDPILNARTPIVVTREQLEAFMAGNWGARAISPKS